jgi:hypothetical protein
MVPHQSLSPQRLPITTNLAGTPVPTAALTCRLWAGSRPLSRLFRHLELLRTAMPILSHSTATLKRACITRTTTFVDPTALSQITTTQTRSAWEMRCGPRLCNRFFLPLCITSTLDSRVHYPGVLRQDYTPVLSQKILLVSWRVFRLNGCLASELALVHGSWQIPVTSLCPSKSSHLYLRLLVLYCCRLISLWPLWMQVVIRTSTRSALYGLKAGVWRPTQDWQGCRLARFRFPF